MNLCPNELKKSTVDEYFTDGGVMQSFPVQIFYEAPSSESTGSDQMQIKDALKTFFEVLLESNGFSKNATFADLANNHKVQTLTFASPKPIQENAAKPIPAKRDQNQEIDFDHIKTNTL